MSRRRHVLIDPQEAVDVVRAYESGDTLQEIADRFGCSLRPVRRILEEAGVDRRRPNERLLTPAERVQIAEAYQAGASAESLAERHARGVRTIHRLLAEEGVARRTRRS